MVYMIVPEQILPICLLKDEKFPNDNNQTAFVAGWGYMSNGEYRRPTIFLIISNPTKIIIRWA